MKITKKYAIGMLFIMLALLLESCGSSGSYSGSGGGSRSVNHYHHNHGARAWGSPYYGNDVIIIDDGADIGVPEEAVTLPADDW